MEFDPANPPAEYFAAIKSALETTSRLKARMAADEAKLEALLRDLKQLRKEMAS